MAGRQQTAPPQKRRSKDATAHPHQPGARPEPPNPDPAHSRRNHPAKAKVKFPLRNRILLGMSESTRDQRMTPQLAPVAFVDLTVRGPPREASPPREARPLRTRARARRRRGRTLTEKKGAVVGAEAPQRASVGMASSGASAEFKWLFITYVKGTIFGMSESGEASKRR
jgi:hypothetical protein